MATYSILIKGGMVFLDKKLERLDVGVRGDKIQTLGDLSRDQAELVIDASGKYVSPGFIDITNHSDTHWTLFNTPRQESLLSQGITTILGGSCGSSLAPLVRAKDIEGIQKWTDIREININWHKLSEFFEELSRHGFGVNFGTLVGHGTLRRGIIGDDARSAESKEIDEMCFLLQKSMEEGAFGLSTSLGAAHGRSAEHDELAELFHVVSSYNGLTKHHLKDEGKNILPAIVELLQLGRETGVKIEFSHFKILGRSSWNLFQDALKLIESARGEGVKLTLDIFPYTRTGSALYLFLPSWMLEGGRERILHTLQDKTFREEVILYLKSLTLHYERITVASTLKDERAIGRTIQQLSELSALSPEEVILGLLEVNELKVSIFNEVISPEHLEELIRKDYILLASDGVGHNFDTKMLFDLPHPRSFGSYPRAFEIFVKEREILSWPELIYKMSEFPAEVLGFSSRGKIEKGYFADLVVIDPKKIGSKADYTAPAIRPEGVEWVVVNGEVALQEGAITGKLAGRVLKRK
jgi:N-acyl-D-aspartate/D-glutamate deacylase